MFNFLKSDKLSKSKLKIISGYNFRYRNVGKHSEKTIIKYANYFKFDYEIIKNIKFERHFYWLKIKAIIDKIRSGKKGPVIIDIGKNVSTVKKGDHVVMHWRPSLGIQSSTPNYKRNGKKINAGLVTTFNEY